MKTEAGTKLNNHFHFLSLSTTPFTVVNVGNAIIFIISYLIRLFRNLLCKDISEYKTTTTTTKSVNNFWRFDENSVCSICRNHRGFECLDIINKIRIF